MKGTYDADKDEWRWKVIISDKSNSRYKSGGINFAEFTRAETMFIKPKDA